MRVHVRVRVRVVCLCLRACVLVLVHFLLLLLLVFEHMRSFANFWFSFSQLGLWRVWMTFTFHGAPRVRFTHGVETTVWDSRVTPKPNRAPQSYRACLAGRWLKPVSAAQVWLNKHANGIHEHTHIFFIYFLHA